MLSVHKVEVGEVFAKRACEQGERLRTPVILRFVDRGAHFCGAEGEERVRSGSGFGDEFGANERKERIGIEGAHDLFVCTQGEQKVEKSREAHGSIQYMSFLDGLFKQKEKSVMGVDIGSSSLKVVQLRKEHGKAVLETYGELALGPYMGVEVGQATNLSAEQVVESLKDLMREAKITTTSCGVSIPFARSLLTLVTLPYRANAEEQRTVIEFEARKYIPVPISEVQLDWFIVPAQAGVQPSAGANKKSPTVDVLLVAVHNDELTFLQQVMTGAGLDSSFYEIEIFSTIRAVVKEPVKPVMVIDVGASSTKTYVIEHGVVASSHSINTGSQDITRAIAVSGNISIERAEVLKKEEGLGKGGATDSPQLVFSRIFAEVRRVLIQYETAHQKSVTSIIFTGGGGVTKELGAYAKATFSIDVYVGNPFEKTEAPAFMRPVLESIGPEFAVAVGLALRKLEEL